MTWFADLSSCNYFCSDDSHFLAVGWLTRDKPFPTGEVSEEVFEKLCQLLVNPWNPAYPMGLHLCELCRFTGGTGTGQFKGFSVSGTSAASLFVPDDGVIYVSPSSIAHYIDAHAYQSPDEFCQAVLRCPSMRSVEYFKALLANGARELVKGAAT
jgi:hypothetical protein